MYKVLVPATSANFGPGFDCLGVALNLYNIVEVEEIDYGLQIEIKNNKNDIATDENNLIYKAMKVVFDRVGYKPKGLKIIQTNNIPMTRGLGSSAACIVGGLFVANHIVNQKLKQEELILMASELDGHPDNTTSAIMGGLVISVKQNNKVFYTKINISNNLKFVAFVPDFTLSTTEARMILPKNISYEDAIFNVSRIGLLISSLITGKLENLSCSLEDRLHQPYRKRFIPKIDEIFNKCMEYGARGCYISGAGSTLMALIDNDYENFNNRMSLFLQSLDKKWTLKTMNVDRQGVKVFVN